MRDELTVGEVARLVGVSVRALHHWDEIGLVRPSAHSWGGYRLYSAADVARIHRVLVYRETGMPLARIAEVLRTGSDASHLRQQRDLLRQRISQLQRMVRAVETMLKGDDMGTALTLAEQVELFGTTWGDYAQEAEQRWSDTPEWAQAATRQAAMTKQDWIDVRDEVQVLDADLVTAFEAGVEPGSSQGNALAERHLATIDRWFDAGYAKQVVIARGYVDDGWFAAHYEALSPGLGAWLKTIIDANAAAHGIDPVTVQWG